MKTTNGHWILRCMLGLAVLALPLAFCGCEDSDTDTDISATRFNVDSELWNYSETDEYTWQTTLTQPVVIVRIEDFTEGDVGLRIYDGAGQLVFVSAIFSLFIALVLFNFFPNHFLTFTFNASLSEMWSSVKLLL